MTDYFGLTREEFLSLDLQTYKRDFLPFERWQLETAGAERWSPPDLSKFENQADLYRKLSSVFTAIDIVSSSGALTEFSVARVIKGKEPKDIPGHDFELLLQNPNPLDSRYEFLYATIAFYKLNRNSYWWLNRVDEFSPPDEIWFIPPHMIMPIPDKNLFLRGYLYYPGNGAELFLPPHEIVHFKGFNPFSRFVGLSAAMESLMLLAQSYLGMTEWNTKLYKKSNGRLPSVMAFEQMIADPQWDKIKSDTREATSNREIMMLRGVGQGGLQWIQNASAQKDMEFYTGLDAIDKKIMDTLAPGAYTMLYENANEANSRTGRAVLNELAIYPMHVMMSEKITNGILPAYGTDTTRPLIGHFKDIRLTDRQLELEEQREYSKSHKIDEIREEFWGDDPIGDERGDLLPDELKNLKPKPETPPAPLQNKPAQEMQSAMNIPPQEQNPQDMQTQKSAVLLDNLSKYERFALRKLKDKKLSDAFSNDFIPAETLKGIHTKLQRCTNEAAVKSVFEEARGGLFDPKPKEEKPNDDALILLARSLDNFAARMAEQSQLTLAMEAIKASVTRPQAPQPIYIYPSQVNLPPGELRAVINLPEQATPNVSTYTQIEAAKSPDVHVDAPVYVQNQTSIPETPAPIVNVTNNVEAPAVPNVEIPAPIVNIENKLDAQPAPVVNIENKVEPTPVTLKSEIVTPAPNVTVNNEVKTSKIKRTKVSRDQKGDIEGQDYEYEDDK